VAGFAVGLARVRRDAPQIEKAHCVTGDHECGFSDWLWLVCSL
jgi:hypothetical protein